MIASTRNHGTGGISLTIAHELLHIAYPVSSGGGHIEIAKALGLNYISPNIGKPNDGTAAESIDNFLNADCKKK